jgi:hypothetical protein
MRFLKWNGRSSVSQWVWPYTLVDCKDMFTWVARRRLKSLNILRIIRGHAKIENWSRILYNIAIRYMVNKSKADILARMTYTYFLPLQCIAILCLKGGVAELKETVFARQRLNKHDLSKYLLPRERVY